MVRSYRLILSNRSFPTCFEPHNESEAKCKILVVKVSFHSYANKTNECINFI